LRADLSINGLDGTTIKINAEDVFNNDDGPKTAETVPKQKGKGTAASELIFTLYPLLSKGWVKKLAAITMYCSEGVGVK
jgi:hypothetical protein